MTVIAFRPRPAAEDPSPTDGQTEFTGTFRSPRGRLCTMTGQLRLQRIVITPHGVFVTGVFTGDLREPDGNLIGVDSRRCTVPADLQRSDVGLRAVVRPMVLDLMGITVDVSEFSAGAEMVFPPASARQRGRRRAGSASRAWPAPSR